MKVYVASSACEQRQLNAQHVIDYCKKNNYSITKDPSTADYAFFFTCGVDKRAASNSLKNIMNTKKELGEKSKLIMSGCLPFTNPETLEEISPDYVMGPRHIQSIDDIFRDSEVKIKEIPFPNKTEYDTRRNWNKITSIQGKYENAKNGYKIVISEGCLGRCTYCAIKKAIGKLKSYNPKSLLGSFQKAIDKKEKTIILMAGDTGAYGQDIGYPFFNLLNDFSKVDKSFELYIHDFNPQWLIKDSNNYLDSFKAMKGRLKAINIPVQSGSNSILNLMGRPYRRKEIIETLDLFKDTGIELGTHVIVGFPTEENKDFDETISLLDRVGFNFITAFPYSEKSNTKASKLLSKINSEVISNRLALLKRTFDNKIKIL